MQFIHLLCVYACAIIKESFAAEVARMSVRIKQGIDILELLKNAGYSSYRLRKEKLLGERVIQKLRSGALPSWNELCILCHLLKVQPGDLIEYVEEPEESATN